MVDETANSAGSPTQPPPPQQQLANTHKQKDTCTNHKGGMREIGSVSYKVTRFVSCILDFGHSIVKQILVKGEGDLKMRELRKPIQIRGVDKMFGFKITKKAEVYLCCMPETPD